MTTPDTQLETDDGSGIGGDEPFCEHGNLLWSEECDECIAKHWALTDSFSREDSQPSTPDTQVETLEETAERITGEVAKICGCEWERCAEVRNATQAAILIALRNERARCARIAGDAYRRLDLLNAEGSEPMKAVLTAIREGR